MAVASDQAQTLAGIHLKTDVGESSRAKYDLESWLILITMGFSLASIMLLLLFEGAKRG